MIRLLCIVVYVAMFCGLIYGAMHDKTMYGWRKWVTVGFLTLCALFALVTFIVSVVETW